MTRNSIAPIIFAAVCLCCQSAYADAQYRFTLLQNFNPTDINNNGTIVGTDKSGNVALWSGGTQTIAIPNFTGNVFAINDSGTFVGQILLNPNVGYSGFYANNGNVTTIPTSVGVPLGINSAGTVATSAGKIYATTTGLTSLIPVPPGNEAYGYAISDAGVAGHYQSTNGGFPQLAFSYTVNGYVTLTLGGRSADARSINNKGTVVGSADTPTYLEDAAFVYKDGIIKNLGIGPGGHRYSGALDVNDLDDVVGFYVASNDYYHGFVARGGDQIIDLNTLVDGSACELGAAVAINNSGRIVGSCNIFGGGFGYLLTPVPDASSALQLSLGLSIIGLTTIRRKRFRS